MDQQDAAIPAPSADLPPPLPPPITIHLTTLPQRPCPYLPDRMATNRAFLAPNLSPDLYHDFMDAGFRRSGSLIYQPVCAGCRQCIPLRVPVGTFKPAKSHRRLLRKNADILVTQGLPEPTDEKFDLFTRYNLLWHHEKPGTEAGNDEPPDRESFEAFLYQSPVETIEFTYRDPAGQLLAVGICDLSQRSLSSVYFYFNPDHSHRSLGTFGALQEIAWAHSQGIPNYYLGYWVRGSKKMQYKSRFRPCEILSPAGNWGLLIDC